MFVMVFRSIYIICILLPLLHFGTCAVHHVELLDKSNKPITGSVSPKLDKSFEFTCVVKYDDAMDIINTSPLINKVVYLPGETKSHTLLSGTNPISKEFIKRWKIKTNVDQKTYKAQFKVSKVLSSDAGQYSCIVGEKKASLDVSVLDVTSDVILSVNAEKVKDDSSISLALGEIAISCEVNGTITPEIQIEVDGKKLKTEDVCDSVVTESYMIGNSSSVFATTIHKKCLKSCKSEKPKSKITCEGKVGKVKDSVTVYMDKPVKVIKSTDSCKNRLYFANNDKKLTIRCRVKGSVTKWKVKKEGKLIEQSSRKHKFVKKVDSTKENSIFIDIDKVNEVDAGKYEIVVYDISGSNNTATFTVRMSTSSVGKIAISLTEFFNLSSILLLWYLL